MIRLLLLRRLFEHRLRSLLSLAGVAVGAGLAVAVLGFLGSLTGSVDRFVEGLAGAADVEVTATSDEGMDGGLADALAVVEGVEAAVPMMNAPVIVAGRHAVLLGLDGRAVALGTELGGALGDVGAERDRLLARALEPGIFLGGPLAREIGTTVDRAVRVASAGGVHDVTVLGVVDGVDLNEGRFAVATIPFAQAILGRAGRLDAVLVVAAAGVTPDRLEPRLAPVVGSQGIVGSPARRADQARQATKSMRLGMQLGVGVGFIVGGFVIFNVMSMAAEERRRELATVRAVGGARRPLLVLFLVEAGLLGLAGAAAGSMVGLEVSRRLVEGIPPALASQVGVAVGFRLPPWTIPFGIAGSIAVAVLAALVPARRAVSVPPIEAMRPEGLGHADRSQAVVVGPAVTGVVMAVVFSLVAVLGPPGVGLAAVWGLLVAVILATYGLAAPIARMAAACTNPLGATGRLAGSAVQRAPRRAWAAGAAVAAATASVVAQAGIFDNLTRWIASSFGELDRVGLYVSAEDPNRPGAGRRLPGDWRDGLAALPGVAHVGVHGSHAVALAGRRVDVAGVDGSVGAEPAMAGVGPEVRAAVEAGRGAVVSTRLAGRLGLRTGAILELPTPAGPRRTSVLGVVPSLSGEGELVTVARARLVEWFGRDDATSYLLSLAPGADVAAVRSAAEAFAAQAGVPAFVTTGSQYARAAHATLEQVRSLFSAMTWVIVGAGVLAIVNALFMSVLERRRELGILRALGTSRRQVHGMVALEAGAIGLVGGAIGVGVGMLMHRAGMDPILAPLAQQSALPVEYHPVVGPVPVALLLGMAIAAAGSLFPARRAGRLTIVEAIGWE